MRKIKLEIRAITGLLGVLLVVLLARCTDTNYPSKEYVDNLSSKQTAEIMAAINDIDMVVLMDTGYLELSNKIDSLIRIPQNVTNNWKGNYFTVKADTFICDYNAYLDTLEWMLVFELDTIRLIKVDSANYKCIGLSQ